MSGIKEKLGSLNYKGCLVIIFIFSLCLEIFLFNHSYFFETKGEQTEISLPYNADYGSEAVILSPSNNKLTLNGINKPVYRVRVETKGNEGYVTGKIYLTEDASSVSPRTVNTFAVNPGGDNNSFTASILPNGNTHDLILDFSGLRYPIAVTSVKLNFPTGFSFSVLRFLLSFALISFVFCLFKYKLYAAELDLTQKKHRIINACCLAGCLALSVFYFIFGNPITSTPLIWNMPSYDFIQIGNEAHSLLLPYPQTQEDLKHSDIFVKQMDAFNKGQLNFDVQIDPRQASAPNPYDQGYLMAHKIDFYLEASFYEGKYYSYYGLATLFTIYYPIYFLTGKVPAPGLTCGILSFLAVIAMFFAIRQTLLFLNIKKPNALLFYVGEAATVACSLVYLNQSMLMHYQMQCLSMLFYLALLLGFSFKFFNTDAAKVRLRCLYLLIAGIAVVGVVSARQVALLPAAVVLGCIFITYFIKNYKQGKVIYAEYACLCVPILIGALSIMLYNYARFDSPFEFGLKYQVTGSDHHYDTLRLSLQQLSPAIYHYLLESAHTLKNFPFFETVLWQYQDYGAYRYVSTAFGLLGIPFMYGLFLYLCLFHKAASALDVIQLPSSLPMLTLKWLIVIFPLLLIVLCWIKFAVTDGICFQYLCDTTLFLGIASLMAILTFIRFNGSILSLIAVIAASGASLYSIFMGVFIPLRSDGLLSGMNPDLYITLERIFAPFSM